MGRISCPRNWILADQFIFCEEWDFDEDITDQIKFALKNRPQCGVSRFPVFVLEAKSTKKKRERKRGISDFDIAIHHEKKIPAMSCSLVFILLLNPFMGPTPGARSEGRRIDDYGGHLDDWIDDYWSNVNLVTNSKTQKNQKVNENERLRKSKSSRDEFQEKDRKWKT